uniref:Uncharacterized protein n=1 Tax=Micrurus lemniscatus lemniscatus TaxID=129467 RepID=A0A2D4IT08_MICLE
MGCLVMEQAICFRPPKASPQPQIPHGIAPPHILPCQGSTSRPVETLFPFEDLANCFLSSLSCFFPRSQWAVIVEGEQDEHALLNFSDSLRLLATSGAVGCFGESPPKALRSAEKAFSCQSGALGQRNFVASSLLEVSECPDLVGLQASILQKRVGI